MSEVHLIQVPRERVYVACVMNSVVDFGTESQKFHKQSITEN